jgi:tetratricopeptide (TPR) repeat protein
MRLSRIAVVGFSIFGALSAQTKGVTTTTPVPSNGGNANTGSVSPSTPSTTSPSTPTTGVPNDNYPNPYQRPIFISGRVVLSDGTPLIDRVKIERVCNGVAHVETETDKKGHFSFDLGHSLEVPDASEQSVAATQGIPLPRSSSMGNLSNPMGNTGRRLWGCELRAVLVGFRSDVVQLDNFHSVGIGTIILHRLEKVDGLTISVVSALAPQDARKAYEKGREAEAKNKPDDAQKDFEKAVSVYPKYSQAWYELGRVDEQNNRVDAARKDYQQAIVAEPKFILPHERLSWLALHEDKWQELVDVTDEWLRLDPSNSPDAYYLGSIGNLMMQHFDASEKNAREVIRMDPGKKNMRAHYVLGLALAQKKEFTASAEAIRTYLDATPDAKDRATIEKQLAQIQQAAREQVQSKVDQPKSQ